MNKILVRLIASLAIAVVLILWLTKQGFEVLPSLDNIMELCDRWGIPVYIGLFSLFHLLRAWRWIFLLRPFAKVPRGTMMEVAFLGFAAIQMMPLRTGEVARPYLLDRYAGISKSALFGTIAIERVIDGLVISLMLSAALFTIPSSRSTLIWGLRILPLLIFVAALGLLVTFYFYPERVRHVIGKIAGMVSRRLAEFVTGVLERFHAGLGALPHQQSFWAFVTVTTLYWCINGVAFFMLARACGLTIPPAGAVAGMGCLAVGILLPAGPGYFGNFQVAVVTAVELFLPAAAVSERLAVFVFLLYVLQTGLTIGFGGFSAWRLKNRPRLRRKDSSTVVAPESKP
jgi:uncharacterized protein (TIRG00374 family)